MFRPRQSKLPLLLALWTAVSGSCYRQTRVAFFFPSSRQADAAAQVCPSMSPFGLTNDEDIRMLAIRRALAIMNEIMTAEKKRGSKLEVKQSSIPGAGLGLFALQNLKAGTIISLYPVHGLGVDFGESSICAGFDSFDQEHFSAHNDDDDDGKSHKSNYIHYLMGNRPLLDGNFGDDVLFVDVNPNRPVTLGWQSHLINDGATVETNNESGVLNYYEKSRRAKNCVHVPFGPAPILATVTSRKVKKGQELFTTYGCTYWLDALLGVDEETTDITQAIQSEVKEAARDIFTSMQIVAVTDVNEAGRLRSTFDMK